MGEKNEHSSLAGLRSVPDFTTMRSTTAHSALFVPRHIRSGYRNWKNATVKFSSHERSKCHIKAIQHLYVAPKTTRDVGESLSTLHTKQKRENRRCVLTIVSNLQF